MGGDPYASSMRESLLVGAMCLGLGVCLGAGMSTVHASEPEANTEAEAVTIRPSVEPIGETPAEHSRYRKLDRFTRALALIERYYVRPCDGEALIDGALHGLVADLDPHTIYLAPEDAKLLLEDTEGRFGGVGLIVTLRREAITPGADEDTEGDPGADAEDEKNKEETEDTQRRLVLHIDDVIPGGPAEAAGLVMGDRILAIEGETIAEFSNLQDAVKVMRGPAGTPVRFTVVHEDEAPKTLTVNRAIVDPPAVQVRWLGEGMGVLRLRDFQDHSAREVRAGLDTLEAEAKAAGERLDGVILDLRDNGGGLLDQAIAIADIFIPKGVIVRTRGRQGALLDEARAQGPRTVRDLPLVVLINKGSASASEIVAGALQDHRRALIIGERSYGKGSVQSPFRLGGGALLKLTTALYYTPDDRLIQASGIEPDVKVGPVRATLVDSRPTLRPERAHPQHLKPEDFGREPVPSDDHVSPARVEAGSDAQLLAAIDHLQGWVKVAPAKRPRKR